MTAVAETTPATPRVPSLMRRLSAFVYEGVLLFGVVMIFGYLFSSLTQQRNAMSGRHGLQAFLFVVLGIYFVWFWSRSGQTVAMKAWHVRLVDAAGQPVTQKRALGRYLLSWLWFMPALVALFVAGITTPGAVFGVIFVGVMCYALLARLRPDRQFLHDVLCGTRLVLTTPATK